MSIFQIVNTQGKSLLNMGHKRERKTGSDAIYERDFVQRGVELKILIENGVFYQYIETLHFLLASTTERDLHVAKFWLVYYIYYLYALTEYVLFTDIGARFVGAF